MTGNERYRVYALMNFIGKPITQIMGYAPGKLGIGEDLPKGVFLEWTKWVNNKRYLFDDPALKTLAEFRALSRRAARAVVHRRPVGAGRRSRAVVLRLHRDQAERRVDLTKARRRQTRSATSDSSAPRHRDRLWKDAADWLLAS